MADVIDLIKNVHFSLGYCTLIDGTQKLLCFAPFKLRSLQRPLILKSIVYLKSPGYVFLYAVKLGALISSRVTGLLRSSVNLFWGGNDEVIWVRAFA